MPFPMKLARSKVRRSTCAILVAEYESEAARGLDGNRDAFQPVRGLVEKYRAR